MTYIVAGALLVLFVFVGVAARHAGFLRDPAPRAWPRSVPSRAAAGPGPSIREHLLAMHGFSEADEDAAELLHRADHTRGWIHLPYPTHDHEGGGSL